MMCKCWRCREDFAHDMCLEKSANMAELKCPHCGAWNLAQWASDRFLGKPERNARIELGGA